MPKKKLKHGGATTIVAVEISENKNFYMNFVPAEEQKNYITNLAKPYKWVGLTAAHAMAKIKNVIIAIIPNDGGKPQILKPHGATDIIVLGNEIDYQFQSLITQSGVGLSPAKATNELQKIIDETETIAAAKITTVAITDSVMLSITSASSANNLKPSFASANPVIPFFINNNNTASKDSKLNDGLVMSLPNSNKKLSSAPELQANKFNTA